MAKSVSLKNTTHSKLTELINNYATKHGADLSIDEMIKVLIKSYEVPNEKG